jgi:malonate transporter
MLASFESLLPVFLVIAAGFLIRRLAIVPADQWRGIELAAFWVFFPALVTETLLKADLASIPLTNVAFALLIGISAVALLMLALRKPLMRLLALDGPAYTSIFQAVTRWNGFIALPIVAKLFGDPGVTIVALALAAMVPIINMANISVLAIFATHTEPSFTEIAKTIIRNPLVWGTLVGLALNLSGFKLYQPVMTALELMSGAALGLGLVMVGAGMRESELLPISGRVWAGTLMRLIGTPIVMGSIALALGLKGYAFVTVLICAAVPTAMNGYILAKQMGGDAPYYATLVMVQTVLSLLTIPLIIWLAETYGP